MEKIDVTIHIKIKIIKDIFLNSNMCLEFVFIEHIANNIKGIILIILLSTLRIKK